MGKLEFIDVVWLVPGYLRQNWGSLGQVLVANACVNEIMSYPGKKNQGTVVILNLVIQYKQCIKTAGKLSAGNYPRNLF